jgi:transcriptional regulator with GAF, ATPase, and Fis domain
VFATNLDLLAMCAAGTFREELYERMNGMRVHMPPLRDILAEAPDELYVYVRAFVADKIDAPARVDAWTERVVDTIRATLPGYTWPRNLRELKNYTERFLLTDGRAAPAGARAAAPAPVQPAAAPAAGGTPESAVLSSSETLWARAKAGEVPAEELARGLVTWIHAENGQNQTETARVTGFNWRTVGKLIDPVRLSRWVARKKKEEPR